MRDFFWEVLLIFLVVIGTGVVVGLIVIDDTQYAFDIECCQVETDTCYHETGIYGYGFPDCPDGFEFKHGELWTVDEFLAGGGE